MNATPPDAPLKPKSKFGVTCSQCDRSAGAEYFRACGDCKGEIVFRYSAGSKGLPANPTGMWDYIERLPVMESRNVVTLGEGMTPLMPARHDIAPKIFWKNEGLNPTGSQKDRAISVAISVAVEKGFRKVIVASTGSVGVSCAAYCARAGLACLVVVPRDTPVERLRPMLAYGAQVLAFPGTFEQIEHLLNQVDGENWYHASTIQRHNCYQGEGPKTIAFEIFQQLHGVPDWLVVPVGGGGTLHGIWKGFAELHRDGLAPRVPKIVGVQSAAFNLLERIGNATSLYNIDLEGLVPDERIETVSRNLKHGIPPDGENALRAVRASGGRFISVSDADALAWQLRIAREEGIFCEPSSAVVAAAIAALSADKMIKLGQTIVGILTGAGSREIGVLSGLEPTACPATITAADLDGYI